MKKYHIITFGCQMNKSDSERIATILEDLGYERAGSASEADCLVVNACSVRQPAIDRIWGMSREWEKRRKRGELIAILTGCLLPPDKKNLGQHFDLVFNIKEFEELRNFLLQKMCSPARSCGGNLNIKNHRSSVADYLNVKPKYANKFQAYVPIMTGCNNFCSYCVVPYVRSRETSRSVKSVLTEIKRLAKNGCKEIHLLGQNVNSYAPVDAKSFSENNPFKHNFAKLLWEVNQINGIERVTFSSAHPKDMQDEVISALALPKQVDYLHFALQSGDDQILKAMNRKYTTAESYQIVRKVRKARPNIALGTDIIVGFPGETRKQFENTLKFYKKVGFDISYNAMYSARQGTRAAELVDDVPKEEKRRRWHELQKVMEKITLKKNQKYVGRTARVLIDTKTKNYCEGNSEEMKRVRIYDPKLKFGDLANVKIKAAKTWLLEA